jgi:DegV family protein with EDD domain
MAHGTAIVTDSSACLPPELLARHAIHVVPLGLAIGGEVFPDGALTPAELFARIDSSRERPRSTSPAPAEFLDAFGAAREDGAASALCLTLSAKYSGTHAAALSAADLASGQLPGFPVRVADTGGLAMTHGFAVLSAARALEAGADPGEAVAVASRVGAQGRLVGALATMQYLVKGGRVPWIVGWAASVLDIHPVLAFADGDARSVARSRTMSRACDRVVEYVARHAESGRPLHAAVMQTAAPERAEALAAAIEGRLAPAGVMRTEFTSVMAVHTGPGFVGVAFYQDD